MRKLVFIVFIFLGIKLTAQTGIPVLKLHATDFTGTLSSYELDGLNKILTEFEKSASVHVIFLYVNSLQGCTVDDYLMMLIKENKIGHGDYFEGAILLFSKEEDIKIIYPSYNYEQTFRPALVSSIIRNQIVPDFETGKYFEGIKSGLEAIFLNLEGKYRKVKPSDYDPKFDFQNHRGLIELIVFSLFIIPWFLKKSRGLGTLFSLRTLSGRKRFLPGLISYYGFDGELRYFYGPFYGLFRRGGPLKSGAHLFKGKIISGKW